MKWFRAKEKVKPFREEECAPSSTGRVWLLVSLLLVLAPHLYRQPLLVSTLCVAVLGWCFLHELREWPLPTKVIKVLLTILMFAIVLSHYHTINGIQAGSAMLSAMLCMKLLEIKSQRDSMVAIFIGYFLILAGFLYDQSIASGVYLFVVVWLLTSVLFVLNHTRPYQGKQSLYYLRLSGSMLLQALPLMLILFLLFPRIPGPLWSLPSDNRTARTGLSDNMNIGSISNLADSDAIAFRVTFDGEIPPASQLYWRGPVLWQTDGKRWQRLEDAYPGGVVSGAHQIKVFQPAVSYTLTLEPHDKRWLFAMDLPATIPDGAQLRFDFQMVADKDVTELKQYKVTSYPHYDTGQLIPYLRRLALALPDDKNRRTLELGHSWREQGLMPAERVEQALNYLRQQPFYYTRQPPVLSGDSVIDQFLFETRRGFCEHFAASFVTLMRAAGVPARVVTGYQGGEVNPNGNYLMVRQSDAHAWAEVWLEGAGWQRIDPTSVIPPERIESNFDSVRFNDTLDAVFARGDVSWLVRNWNKLGNNWDAINYQWNNWVLGFGRDKQQQLLQKLGFERVDWQLMVTMLFILLGSAFLIVALYIFIKQPRERDPLQRGFQQFCYKLGRAGVKRQPNEGAVDFARRASDRFPALSKNIHSIVEFYTISRYRDIPDKDELKQFKEMVNHFSVKR